jgi:NADH-quinone oxidoreductase subunit N
MHFYVADVYQGAAAPVTGILGFVPKFAGFLAIMQILAALAWQYGDAVFWLLWALAAATMTVGNTLALMQHNVKRMLAYSSVAHTGYMLIALVAGPAALMTSLTAPLRNGLTALLFYMAVYGVMNLGAFAALSYFRKGGPDDADDTVESLDDLAGSARRHPWATLALAICVLGLMGFPLTGGFFGKLYVFSAALSASGAAAAGSSHGPALLALVIIGALNAAVAAAYYLRILASCYLRKPAEGVSPSRCHALGLSLAICAVLVLAVFARPHWLLGCSADAAGGLSSSHVVSEARASNL